MRFCSWNILILPCRKERIPFVLTADFTVSALKRNCVVYGTEPRASSVT